MSRRAERKAAAAQGITAQGASAVTVPKRRNLELFLALVAVAVNLAGYVIVHLNRTGEIPPEWPVVAGGAAAVALVAHLVVRLRLPYADPIILPSALFLNGLGLLLIHRMDLAEHTGGDRMQVIWTLLGIALFLAAIIVVHDHRKLQRYPYVLFIIGMMLLLMPLVPGLGSSQNGADVWVRIGPLSFQPGEIAKIVLSLAFAAYLCAKRDVLALGGRTVLGVTLPRARDLGPIALMWVFAVLILVFQTDLGMSLLFFGLFVVMLYAATERPGWAILGTLMFMAAAVVAWFLFGHVKRRVNAWLTPFDDYDRNYQVIQAQFGIDWGGLLGRGLGLGQPGWTIFARSDMIFSIIGEELGVAGMFAVILIYAMLVARGFKAALGAREPFGKLLATGLTFSFGLQVFLIIGGVTRTLPLTGLTTPFMSQGGTSLVANWIVISLLLIVSHYARRPVVASAPPEIADLSTEHTQTIPAVPVASRGEFA